MNEAVSHTDDLWPRKLRNGRAAFGGHLSGSFADYFQLPDKSERRHPFRLDHLPAASVDETKGFARGFQHVMDPLEISRVHIA